MSEIDHEVTDEIVCPYCGYVFSDSWEHNSSELMECRECSKYFGLSVSHSTAYTTSKMSCANGESEHRWSNWAGWTGNEYRYCKGCDKREYRKVR
jgi:hypothetical protein